MSIWAEYAEDYWKSRRSEALLSTGAAWEHVLQKRNMSKLVKQRLVLLAAATQSDDATAQ